MNFTEEQKSVISARNSDLLVSAAAGSGKTAVLVERVIQMISDPVNTIDIDNLLVVTFTKAAAAQMKEKIAKALEEKLQKDPGNEHLVRQINYINHANILTIDSFCYRVVKEYFYMLDIDPGVRVGTVGEIGLLRRDVMEKVVEEYYKNNPDFISFSDAFSADKNDEKIEDYIEKIYDISASYPRPFLWTENARKELAPEDETEFCALSYVRDYFLEVKNSAKGIKERMLLALEQARSANGPFYMEKAFLSDIELVDMILSARTYTQFADLVGLKFSNIGRGKKGTYDEELAEQLKKTRDGWKDEIKKLLSAFELPIDDVLARMKEQSGMLSALLNAVDSFREEFMAAKRERNILEFSDVEHLALQVLSEGYDEHDVPVPSRIAKELSEQYAEILIDEYQDSNFLQEAILSCVSRHHEGMHNIFMVGDVKQSIYSFRMARPDLFMDKYHTYEEKENALCRKLLLKNNFRSRANVLGSINYMFYQLMGEDLGGIEYTTDEALMPGRIFPDNKDDSVEIMIGESRDFDFLVDGSAEMSAERKENLDDDLEDIGRMELEASMIAKRIREIMGREDVPPLMVTDGEGVRPLRYGDIVLLFRAPSSFSSVFSETLMSHGIPVAIQNEKGYFDTVEIRGLISLLRVLDNPLNEVELVAVLRGYFCGLDSNELAIMSLIKRDGLVFDLKQGKDDVTFFDVFALLADTSEKKKKFIQKIQAEFSEYGEMIENDLIPKTQKLFRLLKTLKEIQTNKKVNELIEYIYHETAYVSYVSVMPEGKRRKRNLDLFLSEAKEYEKKSYGSLFAFLAYIDKLEKKEIILGGDPSDDFSDNAVRIMSIHKSKGLEFPVVFLSGMGKQFNLTDAHAPLIIHSDYHIGAKYRNAEKRCGNDMFSRKAMAARMLTECIAEELRIFYVGLTRAKDKLILTGVTPDIVALVKKYEIIASRRELKLSYSNVHTARSYLDFTVMSMMRNPAFFEAMKQVRKRMDKKGEQILSAEYENRCPVDASDCKIKIEVYDFRNLLVRHMRRFEDDNLERDAFIKKWEGQPESARDKICDSLSWKYDNGILTKQKSKLSVTEIKRIYELDFEPSDVLNEPFSNDREYIPPVPEFIAGKTPFNAAEKGTWVHKTMELVDFAGIETKNQVAEALETLWRDGRIAGETKDFIDADMIWRLADSDLGRRMRAAAKEGRLYKEKQFVVGVPMSELMSSDSDGIGKTGMPFSNETIVVQGIIDVYFREGDQLILVDYKTDRVKAEQENLLVKRYHTQLRYYKDTLEKITGRKVSETYIYSFSLNKAIRLF